MTNCAETARPPDEQQLVDVASILAAGILRLQERQSLPVPNQVKNCGDSSPDRLELSGESVLSVVHGGYRREQGLWPHQKYFARLALERHRLGGARLVLAWQMRRRSQSR